MIAMTQEDGRKLITPSQAAEIAGVSREAIRQWMRRGRLVIYKRQIDGRKLVDEEELRRKLRAEPES